MKATLVLHSNHEDEKEYIRKESWSAEMMVTRLVISHAVILGFTVGVADMKGAYMQSGPICRNLYVHPDDKMAVLERNTKALWNLVKLPYGVVEASWKWLKNSDDWTLKDAQMDRALGIHQLFYRRDESGKITPLVAKTRDDFMVSVTQTKIMDLFGKIENEV